MTLMTGPDSAQLFMLMGSYVVEKRDTVQDMMTQYLCVSHLHATAVFKTIYAGNILAVTLHGHQHHDACLICNRDTCDVADSS
jgi:hypothetical protein